MPATNPVLIRRAQPDEAEPLSRLAFRSKASWGYPEAFMEACRQELTLSPAYLTENPTFVLTEADLLIGFYALEAWAATEAELGYLFVEPAHLGRGYGRLLMDHAKEQARALGYRALMIQGDPHAARFYQAAGGYVVGAKESASIPGRTLPLFRIDF